MATKLNAIVLIVVGATVLLPMVMNDGGPRGYHALGRAIAYVLSGAVVFVPVAMLSARGRSPTVKAGTRLAVAALLLGLSALGAFR